MNTVPPRIRFREARERLGITPEELAARCGLTSGDVWDIEDSDDELTTCHSPRQLQHLCRVLGIRPLQLFGVEVMESPISAEELVRRIREQCLSRGITLEQFEVAVGWCLNACMEPPERLLEDMTIDGLQWLCRELGIDWHRVIQSL